MERSRYMIHTIIIVLLIVILYYINTQFKLEQFLSRYSRSSSSSNSDSNTSDPPKSSCVIS